MGKNRKKVKDPLAPKKPLNPYLEFAKAERENVLADLGPLSIGEIGKELGRRWKNLPLEQKKKFQEQGIENTVKYEAEKKDYQSRRVPPKKPLSPYLEFSKEERSRVIADLGSSSFGEVGKEVGRRWKELPHIQKERFQQIAKGKMEDYVKDMAMFSQETSVETSSSSSLDTSQSTQPTNADSEPVAEVAATAPDEASCSNADPPEADPSQVAATAPEESSCANADPPPSSNIETLTLASDLGFAKQRFYPWHPALKTGILARGSRISVTYFGTAQTGTVDKCKWVPFSDQSMARICSPGLLKIASFKKGLDQLKVMLAKIKLGTEKVVKGSGVGFSEQPVGRKLVKFSKDGLQKDEEQNRRFMKEKILELKEKKYKWGCRDCSWKGVFSHKAKAHARDCGSRRRENLRKSKIKKYECSGGGCTLAFYYLSKLQKHYRYFSFLLG